MRSALAVPDSQWYLLRLANMSTLLREWIALHLFSALACVSALLGQPVRICHSNCRQPARVTGYTDIVKPEQTRATRVPVDGSVSQHCSSSKYVRKQRNTLWERTGFVCGAATEAS